jgi:integrase
MPTLRDNTINARIYTKAGSPRFYADFRDYADVGGKLEALRPEGSRFATTDRQEAQTLAEARLEEVKKKRLERPSGPAARRRLSVLISDHLERKAKNREAQAQWLGNVQVHLETVEDFFGADRDLADIELREVEEYRHYLFQLPNGNRGGTLSDGSVAHYINSFSNLYRRAITDGLLRPGANVVEALSGIEIERTPTPFLEVPEMAEILRYAFEEYEPARPDLAVPFFPVILAGLALGGFREAELLGARRTDVDLDRRVCHVRKNAFRPSLKTKKSARVVPVFDQFAEFLDGYLSGPHAPRGQLLFPSPFAQGEARITELRKQLDRMPMPERLRRPRTPKELEAAEKQRESKLERVLGRRRGPKPTESVEELERPVDATVVPPLRTKILRHTYTAARLQTTDHGQPIALYTVARELGHQSTDMVEEVYAHLGQFRHRGEQVEYRW